MGDDTRHELSITQLEVAKFHGKMDLVCSKIDGIATGFEKMDKKVDTLADKFQKSEVAHAALNCKEHGRQLKKHGEKIQVLNNWRWKLIGISIGAAGAASLVLKLLTAK